MASNTAALLMLDALWAGRGNRSLLEALNAELLDIRKRARGGAVSSVSNNGSSVSYQATSLTSIDTEIKSVLLLLEYYHTALGLLLAQGRDQEDGAVYEIMREWLSEPVTSFTMNHGPARL